VCGITDFQGVDACIRVGVDHIGLNFVPSSRRLVDLDTAVMLAERVGGRIPLVGVFMDHTKE
jgi:phosphoribosylanthranilate isomerase